MGRPGRVAATQFLHAALNGVFGIFPAGIFVFVIIFFNKPGNVFIDAVEIFLHQRKDGGIEFFFLFTGKLFVGTFAENFKVIEAESFGICHLCTEMHIFFVHGKEGFHVSLKGIFYTVTDETGGFPPVDPLDNGIGRTICFLPNRLLRFAAASGRKVFQT